MSSSVSPDLSFATDAVAIWCVISALAVMFPVLVLCAIRSYELSRLDQERPRALIWLFLMTASFFFSSIFGGLRFNDWAYESVPDDEAATRCYWISKTAACTCRSHPDWSGLYHKAFLIPSGHVDVIGNMFLYLYLYERMRATRLLYDPTLLEKMLLLSSWSVMGIVPIVLLPINEPQLLHGTICTFGFYPGLNSLFTVMDTSLSLGFLYIFYTTLREHREQLEDIPGTKQQLPSKQRLLQVMKLNLKWSTVAMVSTFVAMSTIALSGLLLPNRPAMANVIGTFLSVLDMCINVAAVLMCTVKLWMPQQLGIVSAFSRLLPSRLTASHTGNSHVQPSGWARIAV